MPPTSLPLVPEPRTALVKVPVTPSEKSRLSALAASQGRSVSELIRLALPLSDTPSARPFSVPFPRPQQVVVTRADA